MDERVDISLDCDSQTADAVSWFQKNMGIEDWSIEVVDSDVPPDWAEDLEIVGQLSRMYCNRSRKMAGIWLIPAGFALGDSDSLSVLFSELDEVVMSDISNEDPEPLSEGEEFVNDLRGKMYAAAYRAGVLNGN